MSDLAYKPKELQKMVHIESFVQPDKTIVQYRPRFWNEKKYIVGSLKKNKKEGDRYELVFESPNLDASIFVYQNLHILEVMKTKKSKPLLKLNFKVGENVSKVLLLESDIEQQTNAKLTLVNTKKDMKINVIEIKHEDDGLWG